MSVKRGFGGKSGGNDPALLEKVNTLTESAGRIDTAAAFFSTAIKAQIKADRKTGGATFDDALILQSAGVVDYAEWSADGVKYEKGDILTDGGGLLFEVVADHTSNAAYPLTTFAYYRLIERAHSGGKDDPIPYPEAAGIVVNAQEGKYYAYKGVVYLCKGNMPNCVYPPDTAGLWQWEAIK